MPSTLCRVSNYLGLIAIPAVQDAGLRRGRAEGGMLCRGGRVPAARTRSCMRGVDEPVALFGRQAAHPADRPVDGLAAVGRQLLELLKDLARLLLLIRRQVLPGFHAVENALLLLRRQAGEMLQPLLQLGLLLRRKPAELRIVFERAALLRGRQIFIAAEPVSGVAGLVLRRMELIGTAGAGILFLKAVPLPVRRVRLRMRLWRPLRLPRLRRRL